MNSFAYYRLPYSDTFTKVVSQRPTVVIGDMNEVGNEAGFIIAPFKSGTDRPAVLILPDSIETKQVDVTDASDFGKQPHCAATSPDAQYDQAFSRFHNAINSKEFKKLVLARTKDIAISKTPEQIFHDLCQRYPRLMIMLFSTPLTGTWVVASPEILIESKDNTCHTIALAGTMPFNDGYATWSEKNKREQHIVEQYIEEIITPLSQQVVKDGPYTTRAGDLQHLRTDFRFHLSQQFTIGYVLANLHPTPAVCGLPTARAKDFILENEGIDRRYYSGFAGPVGINDETHIYVSLRCAELQPSTATLYAGGGIMPDSQCTSEWRETEDKMQTINNVLK